MSENAKVDWYTDDVLLIVDNATDELLTELAFYVEGEAKVGATVDTGFMRNAIYAVTPLAKQRAQAEVEAKAVADRPLAPEPKVDDGTAAVHAAAEYTIYQEMRVGFFYHALEMAREVAPGFIQTVGRKHFD